MVSIKRERKPDEATEHTSKYRRIQKESHALGLGPLQSPGNSNEAKFNRPGLPSEPVSHAGSLHSPPVPLPPGPADQRAKRPQRLRLTPPKSPKEPAPSQAAHTVPESSTSETSTCYSQPVANYDVGPGVEPVGDPDAEDERWQSVVGADEFIHSKSGLEDSWIGVRPLGKGGNGMAGLWESRDDAGRLVKVRLSSHRQGAAILTIAKANGNQRGNVLEKRVGGRRNRTRSAGRGKNHE